MTLGHYNTHGSSLEFLTILSVLTGHMCSHSNCHHTIFHVNIFTLDSHGFMPHIPAREERNVASLTAKLSHIDFYSTYIPSYIYSTIETCHRIHSKEIDLINDPILTITFCCLPCRITSFSLPFTLTSPLPYHKSRSV